MMIKADDRTDITDEVPYSILDFMRLNSKLANLDIPVLHGDVGICLDVPSRHAAPALSLNVIAPVFRDFATALNTYVYLDNARERPPPRDEYELLCYCMVSGGTLGEGIKRAVQFVSALNGRGATLTITTSGDKAIVTCETGWKNRSVSALSVDILALTFYGKLFAWLIDEPLADLELTFSHKSLLDPMYLRDLMNCKSRFEDTDNTIVFNKALLSRPIVKTPRQLGEMLAQGPLELLPTPKSKCISVHVQNLLRKTLVEQEKLPALDHTAYQLGQSGSTLRRRLKEEGTSFQELLDECRKTRAIELLACAHLSIDEIASSLGFSERSSFSHAFKGWTNRSPSTYRDTILQVQTAPSRVA